MEILLIILLVLAIFAAVYFYKRKEAAENQFHHAETENAALRSKIEILEKPHTLSAQEREGISEALKPMRESVEAMRNKLDETRLENARERSALDEKMRMLATVSETLGGETRRLSDALKGNTRFQGQWGERVLENILEQAGLRRNEDFMVQTSVQNDEGSRLRPDVIIRYSEGRNIAVDAKTSIGAYLDLCNASTDDERTRARKAHLESVHKHISELKTKSYQDFLGEQNADFVLMFIPNEGAYMTAMDMDKSLWETAYSSRVIIISPTHLLSVLKLIEQIWRNEKQTKNVAEIAEMAGKMLDKFSSFLDDMSRIRRGLESVAQTCDNAMTKLNGRGGLISKAANIKNLGVKTKLILPSDDEAD